VSQKYEFIDAEYADASAHAADNAPAIVQMCRWLGVSKSGFYEWRSRPESATAKRQERLKLLIKKIFDDSDSTYGYRRIARQLARQGVVAGAELVRKLMRVLGLVPCQPRPWRPQTTRQGAAGPIPDLVNRDFSAAVPGEKMVGDITYIPTWEGWVYLASVIDCATRKCVGWAMGDNYKTPLITNAIEMAARNLDLPPGAVFHSDRGSNYQCHLVKLESC
jgi:putative transposase